MSHPDLAVFGVNLTLENLDQSFDLDFIRHNTFFHMASPDIWRIEETVVTRRRKPALVGNCCHLGSILNLFLSCLLISLG